MKVGGEITVYFDVDETLISFRWKRNWESFYISLRPRKEPKRSFWANQEHLRAIREHKRRGHTVVVWSAGGAAWAEMVVKALGLIDYVDFVISKPHWYYDDKDSSEFMKERIFHDLG